MTSMPLAHSVWIEILREKCLDNRFVDLWEKPVALCRGRRVDFVVWESATGSESWFRVAPSLV